jgi:phosphatidylglycerol---prolipoprotein diacylglyceryl transferase
MYPIIQIGPAALPVSSLLLLAGVWLGSVLAERYCHLRNISASDLNSLIVIGIFTGLIGARMGYVIRYPDIFLANPLSIATLRPVLLDPVFGSLVAMIAMWIYIQRKNLALLNVLDAFTPFFAVFVIALGFSHLASGSEYGSVTNLPWSIHLWGQDRHPTQVYEITLSILTLILFIPNRGPLWSHQPGVTFLRFIAITAVSTLIVESYRVESNLIFYGIRANQVVAWAVLAASLIGLGKIQFKSTTLMKGSNS